MPAASGSPAQAAIAAPLLEPTELTFRESLPGVIGFIVVIPLIATPWLLGLAFRSAARCGSATSCVTNAHLGLKIMAALVGSNRTPQALLDTPILADGLLGLVLLAAVIMVSGLAGIPLFGGFAPALQVKRHARPRTSESYDFLVREAGKPYRIAIHTQGRYAGYPGEALISVKLHLQDAKPLTVERAVRPIAEPARANQVTEYVFDPVYFQFISAVAGSAQLWVGYGNGPECLMTLSVTRRS